MSQAHTVEHDQGIGGAKTIGFWGGFNLLANNICGPAIVLLPALFQQAGLIPTLVGLFVITFFCYICSWMLIEAMRLMPHNKYLTQRYEYMGLCEELLYKNHYWIIYVCYNISALSVLISNIIQTVQVMDIAISDIFGCSYGFEYYPNPFRFPCGNDVDNVEPFDDWVISIGFVIVALISIPFGILNLDDNIILCVYFTLHFYYEYRNIYCNIVIYFRQWIATVGFAIMAIMWVVIYCYQDTFSFDNIPWATWELSNLVGVILFNYGYIVTLPSWANETKVSTSTTNVLIFSLVFMLIEFIVVGLFGGWAYAPYYNSDNDLFNEMNEYSGLLAKITVYLEPIIQNLTSIPVFSIVIRYNLLNTGFNKFTANMWAIVFPWLVSIPLYNGNGFNDLCNWTGVIFAACLVISFIFTLKHPLTQYNTFRRQFHNTTMVIYNGIPKTC